MTRAGLGASMRLAWRRLRGRPIGAISTSLALVAAAALVGWGSIAVAVAQDQAVEARLRAVPPEARSLRVVYSTVAGTRDKHAAAVASVVRKFASVTESAHHVTVRQPIGPADERGTSFVTTQDPAANAIVDVGRVPRGSCGARRCEALALKGRLRRGQTVRIGPAEVAVVGVGSMKPVALPSDLKPGARMLLVRRIDAPRLRRLMRTEAGTIDVTTLPFDARTLRAADLARTLTRVHDTVVRLNRSDAENLVRASAPERLLRSIERRGTVARYRLLLISGQAAALVVAFAAFIATTRRREVLLLEEQLVDLGANRFQAWRAAALEVVVPGIAAAALAFAVLVAAAALMAPADESAGAAIAAALPWQTVATVLAIVLFGVALLLYATRRPGPRRFGLGAIEAAAVAGAGLIVWEAVSTNGLSADQVAKGGDSPLLLMLPGLTFFVSSMAFARLLPLLVRIAERYARRASTGVRLAFVDAARRPSQAAVATTFLAIAIGAAAFSFDYRATLERQATDQANFTAGAAWRVTESARRVPPTGPPGVFAPRVSSATDVTPLTRYAALGGERPTPALRLEVQQGDAAGAGGQSGTAMTLLALPAGKLREVRGWRSGFADDSRDELARKLRPHAVVLDGPRLGRRATDLRLWVRTLAPYPTTVVLWFLLPGEETRSVSLGPPVAPSRWTRLRIRAPAVVRGCRLIGIDLQPVTPLFGARGFVGTVWLGSLEQRQAGVWSDMRTLNHWATTTDPFARNARVRVARLRTGPVGEALVVDRNGTSLPILRRRVAIPAAIPVLASPGVAASAVDGETSFVYGGLSPVRVRVVATTQLFPTITGGRRFIVADYETAYAVLNAIFPGITPPSETWFFGPQRPSFRHRLAQPPFRVERIVERSQLEQELMNDPLARGTRSVLLVSGIVAAALALIGLILAIQTSLRNESTMHAEYEALGISPNVLARSAGVRLAALSFVGVAAGVGGSFLALRLISTLVSVTAGGGVPVPSILPVVVWPAVVFFVVGFAAAGFAGAYVLSRRAFSRPVAERLRI